MSVPTIISVIRKFPAVLANSATVATIGPWTIPEIVTQVPEFVSNVSLKPSAIIANFANPDFMAMRSMMSVKNVFVIFLVRIRSKWIVTGSPVIVIVCPMWRAKVVTGVLLIIGALLEVSFWRENSNSEDAKFVRCILARKFKDTQLF